MRSHHFRIVLLGGFFLFGLLLLGSGITGYVVGYEEGEQFSGFGLVIVLLVGLLVAGEVIVARRKAGRKEKMMRLV